MREKRVISVQEILFLFSFLIIFGARAVGLYAPSLPPRKPALNWLFWATMPVFTAAHSWLSNKPLQNHNHRPCRWFAPAPLGRFAG